MSRATVLVDLLSSLDCHVSCAAVMALHSRYVHEEELETKHTVRLTTAEIGGACNLPSVKDRLIQNVHKQSHSFAMHSLLQIQA